MRKPTQPALSLGITEEPIPGGIQRLIPGVEPTYRTRQRQFALWRKQAAFAKSIGELLANDGQEKESPCP